jgi:hypothetical protein
VTAARSRLERVRASTGIAQLALQQIEDELADLADAELVAGVLRELFDEADPPGGLLGSLQQLLTTAAQTVLRTPLDQDDAEAAGCALEEAAGFVIDSAGMRLHQATSNHQPQGDRP